VLHRCLLNTVTREYGKPNGIFRWAPDILDFLYSCLVALPAPGMMEMMRRMAQDYRGNCSGYPDLVVMENDRARFVEVKAEGDQLRRNQLKQITALQQAGIPVSINRVHWAVDPDQSYAVVDIETTGRRGDAGRITEIGAVRMRGDRIVDTWQSLVQPGRSIPRSITRLTGIDDAMVADAPRFSEIADQLREFTGGCIFVAHNVRFDYGFICDEYRRLGQSYHRPTFCTVSGMRRWYPGLASYSLGNLCRELGVSLVRHHRALNDARAAADLLVRINRRRRMA
jgi:DNA polymerase-3 subunit epsilon